MEYVKESVRSFEKLKPKSRRVKQSNKLAAHLSSSLE